MEPDFSLFGNAAALPIIIAITQGLKKIFNFKRKADVISLLVSIAVCVVWEFYYTPETELHLLWGGTLISQLKHVIDLMIVSFATWLSAAKSYDLFLGEKRRAKEIDEHLKEKEELRKEVEQLKNGHTSEGELSEDEPAEEPTELDNKLREILEGK